MNRLRRIAGLLLTNAIFWILLILGGMILFIVNFEKPVNFAVDKVYNIF